MMWPVIPDGRIYRPKAGSGMGSENPGKTRPGRGLNLEYKLPAETETAGDRRSKGFGLVKIYYIIRNNHANEW